MLEGRGGSHLKAYLVSWRRDCRDCQRGNDGEGSMSSRIPNSCVIGLRRDYAEAIPPFAVEDGESVSR